MKTKSFSGEKLRRLRVQKGLTQTELGSKAGLSTRMIVHYEKHIKRPPADKLASLAKSLNTNVDELLNGDMPAALQPEDKSFAKKLERAKSLPSEDKKILSSMIDNFLSKANGKKDE